MVTQTVPALSHTLECVQRRVDTCTQREGEGEREEREGAQERGREERGREGER